MTRWDQILRDEWFSQEKPDEIVVSFTKSLKKKNDEARVLDLGCGAGRNLIHMASQGFETHGLDISATGLKLTRQRLRKLNLKAFVTKGQMTLLPYINSSFDIIICLFAIYHQKLSEMETTISEIRRVLKQEGTFIVNFQSKRSQKYGRGIAVEDDTFMETGGPEDGVLHHFTDEEEVRRLLKDFKSLEVDLQEERMADDYLQSRITVIAKA